MISAIDLLVFSHHTGSAHCLNKGFRTTHYGGSEACMFAARSDTVGSKGKGVGLSISALVYKMSRKVTEIARMMTHSGTNLVTEAFFN